MARPKKLTDEQVWCIRNLDGSFTEFSREYNVCFATIRSAYHGKSSYANTNFSPEFEQDMDKKYAHRRRLGPGSSSDYHSRGRRVLCGDDVSGVPEERDV